MDAFVYSSYIIYPANSESHLYATACILSFTTSTKRGTTNIVTDQNATNVEQSNVTTTAWLRNNPKESFEKKKF